MQFFKTRVDLRARDVGDKAIDASVFFDESADSRPTTSIVSAEGRTRLRRVGKERVIDSLHLRFVTFADDSFVAQSFGTFFHRFGDLRKLVILHRSIGNGIHSDDFTKPDSDGDDNENRHKSARRQISARSCARVLCFFF